MGKHNRMHRRSSEALLGSTADGDEVQGLNHELHSEAKLWSMYVDEATEHDKHMLKGWSDGLDVLLILAGLFSAVLTAFLVESYKLLQPDPQQTTAALLVHVVERLDEILHTNDSVTSFPISANLPTLPSQPFQPAASAWWLNVLWFSSLVCSLSAAFIAMLSKQWLQAYNLGRPGRMEMHARQRHFRYSGLQAWKVSEIVSTLPVLLQIGFGLFFGGLNVLLWSINQPIAYFMMFLTALLLVFYSITTVAPLFDLACPFKTPFSLALRTQIHWVYSHGFALVEYGHALLMAVRSRTSAPSFTLEDDVAISNEDMEQVDIDQAHHVINVGVIEWLIVTSHKHEVVDAALKAISSLRPDFNATPKLRDSGAIQLLVDRLDPPNIQLTDTSGAAIAFRRHAANSVPYLASMLCSLRHCTQRDISQIARRFYWRAWIVSWGEFTFEQLVSDGWDLDALALYLCASAQCDRAEGRRANREFGVMVELLNWHSSGKAEMSSFAVWALVDTVALWGAEFGEPSMLSMRPAVVACLLRLLDLPYTMGDPVTCAIGVALGVFALDFHKDEVVRYRDEEERRRDTQSLLMRGVVEITKEPPGSSPRYNLDGDTFETGGMVICKLLTEFNVTSWPSGVFPALMAVLALSTSETLTCRVLETFRRLPSFDTQSTVSDLSSAIIPLLRSPATQPVQIKATQALGEMMHWREHRKAILDQGGVESLLRNLDSSSDDLSNASSLVLIGLARDPHARDIMVRMGLAEALTSFFGSGNASQQNLAYWSWTFVGSSWTETRDGSAAENEFLKAFRELTRVFEESMCAKGGSEKDVARTPARRRDLQRILQSLKQISESEG